MKSNTNANKGLYGFEGYNIIWLSESCFDLSNSRFYVPWRYYNPSGQYLITKNLPVAVSKRYFHGYYCEVEFNPHICTDHKELLVPGCKVYTHSNCKISRSMMSSKYKRGLDPWTSDVVVVPKPCFENLNLDSFAVFINDKNSCVVLVSLGDSGIISRVSSFPENIKFRDVCCAADSNCVDTNMIPYIMDSEFLYYGDLLYIPNTHNYIADILTDSIPKNKIVYEDTVQESLGDESNKLDFNSLTSIVDMLSSSDGNTVSAGLKALSMMDWMHYSNSIKFALGRVSGTWRYNKACDSTSVKYMLVTLSGSTNRRRWPGNYECNIYMEDFELFKKLKMHYQNLTEDEFNQSLKYTEFMTISSGNIITPNIKVA